MVIRKTISAWICGFCLLSPRAGLAEPVKAETAKEAMQKAPFESGVISRIDTTKRILVISDMVFSYSALSLVVHGEGHTSGVTALRLNQKIQFAYELRKPGSTAGAPRLVTEVWIEQD